MNKLDTVLLVSPSASNRKLLQEVLANSYNLLEANQPHQAELLFHQNSSCIVAIVMDVSDHVLPEESFRDILEQVPLILICEDDSPHVLQSGFGFGASDVIPIGYDPDSMLHRIDTITQLHNHKLYLERMVREQAHQIQAANEVMVDALSSIIEYRSVESGQHILRIRHFTKILLEEVRRSCPEYRLTDEIISVITSASALHDIGKIAIPDAILMKPGKLTQQEREVMQTHALTGCRILESLADMGSDEYLRYAHNICHYHHERWDGQGYPEGLEGDAIPICAQVVGLADVYDALTSARVYKDAYSLDTAVNMILRGECGIFSPKLLECFKHVLDQFSALAHAYADGLAPKSETFDVTLPPPAADSSKDSLDRIQGKFLCLLHYLNCFVLELYVDQGHFHLRYNAYPELAAIGQASSLKEMAELVLDQLVHPQEREQMYDLIHSGISAYIHAAMRRQSFRFHLRGQYGQYDLYEVTLLRVDVNQKENRSLAILCRKLEGAESSSLPAVARANTLPAEYTFCCRNDQHFSLVNMDGGEHLAAGYSARELRDRFQGHTLSLVHPDDRETLRTSVRKQLTQGNSGRTDCRLLCKDGSIQWGSFRFRLTVGSDGTEFLYVSLVDVTPYKQSEEALRRQLDRYEIILAQTENVLFEWDVITDSISFSDTWKQLFGFDPITAGVRNVLINGTYLHPDDAPLLLDGIASLENGSHYETAEVRIATDRGRYLWCRFRATAIRESNGTLSRICGIIINVDAEKQAERDLQERAERDTLTKLLNKQTGRKQVEEYLAHYPKGVHCALLIIDLDNFKQVNDQYGHLFGDAVLTQAARLIRKMFRNQDIIARIGGDEFMVLMRGISDRHLLETRCQRLVSSFRQHFRSQQQPLPLSCSIGIALCPEHGISYYELFKSADRALYLAKAQGRNQFVIYSGVDPLSPGQYSARTAVSSRIDSDSEPGLANSSLVQYAFQRLYAATDVPAAVNELLSVVGKQMNVSRVYVFENSDDNRFCSNTYEWCNDGIHPEIHNLQNISYETDIPNYEDNFNEEGIFYCPDIRELPKLTYDIVAPQGIKSMLHCAIRENGVFRGYIGFDECVTPRLWTKEQIQMLSYFSGMLSVFLLKKQEHDKAIRHNAELHGMLDNRDDRIYLIDPDTCQLQYMNARAHTSGPEVALGMPCYKAIMGTDHRCPGCPAADIRRSKSKRTMLTSTRLGQHIQAEATLVQWGSKERCLLTCREIPGEALLHTQKESQKCNGDCNCAPV